jgi:hypothetical protein
MGKFDSGVAFRDAPRNEIVREATIEVWCSQTAPALLETNSNHAQAAKRLNVKSTAGSGRLLNDDAFFLHLVNLFQCEITESCGEPVLLHQSAQVFGLPVNHFLGNGGVLLAVCDAIDDGGEWVSARRNGPVFNRSAWLGVSPCRLTASVNLACSTRCVFLSRGTVLFRRSHGPQERVRENRDGGKKRTRQDGQPTLGSCVKRS